MPQYSQRMRAGLAKMLTTATGKELALYAQALARRVTQSEGAGMVAKEIQNRNH